MNKKQKMMGRLMKQVYSSYVMPTLSKCVDMDAVKPIAINAALYENDYSEYIASKAKTLTHIHNKREDD